MFVEESDSCAHVASLLLFVPSYVGLDMRRVLGRLASSCGKSTSRDDLFCKIVSGELPCTKRYEDADVLAFDDLHPVAPVHILIVPKHHMGSMQDLADPSDAVKDELVVGKLFTAAAKLALELGLHTTGYRVVSNIGKDAGQSVPHLHVHLIGGRPLRWPPG